MGAVVMQLSGGCSPQAVSGVEYYACTYYRTSFQGNNLVYVVVPTP